MMEIMMAFALSWLCTLSGVALGGWLVYRTKRDDPMLMSGRGEAFNLDDGLSAGPVEPPDMPDSTKRANSAFISQFADQLAKKAGDA